MMTLFIFMVLLGVAGLLLIALLIGINTLIQDEKDRKIAGGINSIPSARGIEKYLKKQGQKIDTFKEWSKSYPSYYDVISIDKERVRSIKITYCTYIMRNEIKNLDFTLYKNSYPYSDRFALKSYKYLNDNRNNRSFKSYLENSNHTKFDGTNQSIAIKKIFSKLSDIEKAEVIQDFFYSQTWHEIISLEVKIKKEGAELLRDDTTEKQRVENQKLNEIAKQNEKKRLRIEEHKQQRIKASTAGKLINKSIQKVENNFCDFAGVYLIVNNITLDFHIGESQNISFRRLTHLGQMAAPENHHRPLIQKHYDQYGASVFDFYVLEQVNNDSENGIARKRIEDFYIKEYSPTYNTDFI